MNQHHPNEFDLNKDAKDDGKVARHLGVSIMGNPFEPFKSTAARYINWREGWLEQDHLERSSSYLTCEQCHIKIRPEGGYVCPLCGKVV